MGLLFCYAYLPEISPSLFTSASLHTLLIFPSTTLLFPPFPLLFYLVLLSKINPLAYAQLHKAACLTQPLQSLCFHLSLSPGLKQESFSVQWYL